MTPRLTGPESEPAEFGTSTQMFEFLLLQLRADIVQK